MRDAERWRRVNRDLVAKTIGECTYEELFDPERVGKGRYRLDLSSGASYAFEADRTPWTWLRVDPSSLRRDGEPVQAAARFLLDAQRELAIDDLGLGELLCEIQNTLYSEQRRRARLEQTDAGELVEMGGPRLETYLDGHPKFLANKGRVGWGQQALARYAPEAGQRFPLGYLAVSRDRCEVSLAQDVTLDELVAQSLDEAAREELADRMAEEGVDRAEHVVLPVHPWQHRRFICTQYAAGLAEGSIVDLGTLGDAFLPQQSIRTLSNVSRPGRHDVKLSLTILNTSCYRGIPGEHLHAGVELSRWLSELTRQDPVLSGRGLHVLSQTGAIHCPHPQQAELDEGPYRFQEMLGAVWRESLPSLVGHGERGILLSTLMQTDTDGRSLVAEYVERSGVDAASWLRELFEAVTVPLYHLMAKHGIGLVAHGQNVNLVLDGYRPKQGVIKDVHGDLRLVDRSLPEHEELSPSARRAVKRLPPEHLLQDLVTGHLVTTLRFVSPLVAEQLGLPETRFYAILSQTLRDYMEEHPELADRYEAFDLFRSPLEKVLVNRVRFRSGFGQDAERPVPVFGTPIQNPLRGGRDA